MRKSEIRVLILEDDLSLGPALKEGIARAGYQPFWVTNPDEAKRQLNNLEFQLAIVDCMLPRSNGVDVISEIKTSHPTLKVILTSGIFKDKGFIKTALHRAGSEHYLSKPFAIEDLLSGMEQIFRGEIEADLPPLWATLSQTHVNDQKLEGLLISDLQLHAFDLIFVLPLIFKSHLSGELVIGFNSGDPATLVFCKGQLVQAMTQDRRSYFGALLVELGYTSDQEVQEILAKEATHPLPLGERMVEAHSLSPHAIDIVRSQQQLLRLSQTIQDSMAEIKWTPRTPREESGTQFSDFRILLWDWLNSKVTKQWLDEFASAWSDYTITFASVDRIRLEVSEFQGGAELAEEIQARGANHPTLQDLAGDADADSEKVRLLVFLLATKLACIGARRRSEANLERQTSRIQRLLEEAANKDHFEILGLTHKSQEKDIQRSYMDLAKTYHPDRMPSGSPKELIEVATNYFAKISAAYDVLRDREKRSKYLLELEQGSAEKILEVEGILDKAVQKIERARYAEALELLTTLAGARAVRGDVQILLAWVLLKSHSAESTAPEVVHEASEYLRKVPPEDRHSANYFFTKGLLYARVGDLQKSKTNLKRALAIDPGMVEARRELAALRGRQRARSDGALNKELTTVFDFLLRRKKAR